MLKIAHVLKYSNERRRIIEQLQAQTNSARVEIETLGVDGVRFRMSKGARSGDWRHHQAFRNERTVDTAGAGDWFTAGFVTELSLGGHQDLRGTSARQLEAAIQHGQALAAWSCGYEGARGAMYHAQARDAVRSVGKMKAAHNRPRITKDVEEEAGHLSDGECDHVANHLAVTKRGDPYRILHR
jgi:fructokinase